MGRATPVADRPRGHSRDSRRHCCARIARHREPDVGMVASPFVLVTRARIDRCQSLRRNPGASCRNGAGFLSDEELKAVWRAADALEQPYAAFVKLLILTGARRNEIAEMRWQEIDLAAKLWTLPKERAKNEREHTVPLSDSAVEILRSLPRIADSDLVFTLNGRNRITAFHLTKQRIDDLIAGQH
jgi:integrase